MASDWNPCEEWLRTSRCAESIELVKLDLFKSAKKDEAESLSLELWARDFCTRVEEENPEGTPRPVLLGYSLGGRLALQALADRPNLFGGAVVVSAHPGLESAVEREERVATDETWAERFEQENWRFLLGAWNRLPAFGGAIQELGRPEKLFSRAKLAAALRLWSVGAQPSHWETLKHFQAPLLWVAGETDVKYSRIAREVERRNPHLTVWLAPSAGHRVPWEQPRAFCEKLEEFLIKIGRI